MERRLERKAGSVELLLLEMHKKTKDKKLLQAGTPTHKKMDWKNGPTIQCLWPTIQRSLPILINMVGFLKEQWVYHRRWIGGLNGRRSP